MERANGSNTKKVLYGEAEWEANIVKTAPRPSRRSHEEDLEEKEISGQRRPYFVVARAIRQRCFWQTAQPLLLRRLAGRPVKNKRGVWGWAVTTGSELTSAPAWSRSAREVRRMKGKLRDRRHHMLDRGRHEVNGCGVMGIVKEDRNGQED
jgi:hypothetical protein